MNKERMGVQEVSPGYAFIAGNPAVPVGYKQTEVGVIPEDWNAVQLGDIGVVIRGASPRPKGDKRFYGGSIPRLMVEDVTRDGKYVTPKVDFLTTEGAMRSRPCTAGTLTLVCSGTVGVPAILKVDACIHDGFLALVNLKDTVKTEYLYYQFEMLRALFDSSATHGGVFTNLTTSGVKEFRVALPSSSEEQQAIATALSDVDALLEELDRLIAKKRDIKQAAMQQLLTGETRLPGFEGEWETRTLSSISDIRSGGTPSTSDSCLWNGGIPWCTPTDITSLQSKYLLKTERTISQQGLKSSSAELIPPGSTIMTSRATIGECAINRVPMATNQGFKNLVPTEVDSEFLYYIMTMQKDRLISLCTGSTFLEIGKKQLDGYELFMPSSVEEQAAIASIISDIDTEIQALEQRRSKTAELKQGMMQELLTGRTRLV